jgi:glycosidase
VPGTPCVYYGDEWATRGTKGHGPGADDAIRPRFDELTPDPAVEDLHRRLIALRRERAWLTDAHLEVTAVANQRLELRVTARHGDGELLLELRFGDTVRNRE